MKDIVLKKSLKDYRINEAYQTLRANIDFSGAENKVIVLTSSTPNEGQGTVALGLSRALAESGKSVLFVDADLRKSNLREKIRITGELKGLSHYLSGKDSLENVIYCAQEQGLFMIFAGDVSETPSELLWGDRFEKMIKQVREKYDYVIIDAPPLGSVIDAAIISKFCDASILVIASNKVSYKFVRMVRNQLEKAGCPILGVVLNKVDMRQNKYYSKYYGNYADN